MTPEEEVQRNSDIADWIVAIATFLAGFVVGRLMT